MARKTYKQIGYAVVTYGPQGTWDEPWFLRKDAKRRYRKNDEVLACHHLTGGLKDAQFFSFPNSAKQAADKVNRLFKENGHILGGKVKVAEIFIK